MLTPEAILVGALMGVFMLGFLLGYGSGQTVGKAQAEVEVYRREYELPEDRDDDGEIGSAHMRDDE